MSQIITNENLIFISDVKGKKSFCFGVVAGIMESLFAAQSDWLTSVKIKKRIYIFENLKVVFVEIESENDLG